MLREKAQAAQTARPKVPMRRRGAHCLVVAMKRGNARGAKGAGHRHLSRVNRQREEPDVHGRRQPSCGGTSRMNREVQVRFCEGLGVKFPGPTRHNRRLPHRNIGVRLCSVNRHTIAADCQRIPASSMAWLPHARSMLEYTRMFRFRRSRLGTRLSRMVCDIISEVGESSRNDGRHHLGIAGGFLLKFSTRWRKRVVMWRALLSPATTPRLR